MWTSNQQIGYMSLTAHFVDKDWKLQHFVINFCEVEPPHTGMVLANVIAKHLASWEIKKKVISITLENASSNDVLVKKLKENMEMSGANLFYEGKLFHVRCCVHILNLMVQDGLSAIREAIKYLKVSPLRLQNFSAATKELEISCTKHLVLDVPTRWNSTYIMLKTTLIYKDVFVRYSMEDSGFEWSFKCKDWDKMSAICKFLLIFQNVSVLFSGSSYPTVNLFLIQAWRVQDLLRETIESGDEFLRIMAAKMKQKFDKYWKSTNVLMFIALILDPHIKLTLSEFIFSNLCKSTEEKEHDMKKIKDMLQEIYDIYAKKCESEADVDDNSSMLPTTNQEVTMGELDGSMIFFKYLSDNGNIIFEDAKSELQLYLEDGLVKYDVGKDSFDILQWWNEKQTKYPILSQIARDMLSIPITSVASEKAFSVGGRVISENRSSLQPNTVEALLCLNSWMKNYGDPMKEICTKVNDDAESCEYIQLP